MEIFLQSLLGESGWVSGGKAQQCWGFLWLCPSGVSNWHTCTHWAWTIHQLQSGFPALLLANVVISALVTHNPLYLSICPSHLGGSVLPFVHIFLMAPKIVIDFPVCSVSHLVLGWSGDFQVPYMWNQKLEATSKLWKTVSMLHNLQ